MMTSQYINYTISTNTQYSSQVLLFEGHFADSSDSCVATSLGYSTS